MLSPCEITSGSRSASAISSACSVPRQRLVHAAGEEESPAELDREHREVGVALLVGEHGERTLQVGDRPHDVALLLPGEDPEPGRDPGRRVREADLLERRDRLLEVRSRRGGRASAHGHLTRALVELGAFERRVGELERLLEVALRALGPGK